eukprot:Tamp_23465.p1 GENE.Tamp_23465~~Tamp_23465.p1  ORF type:complete len:167 (+),score=16.20 Tamp_23465:174-674(+)
MQHDYRERPVLAEELPAAVLAAQCENGGRTSTGGYCSIPSQGHGQDASAADSPAAAAAREYAQGAPGTERPYGSETVCVAAEGKEGSAISGRRTVMTRNRMPKRKAVEPDEDECTAWTCLPKILHDQVLRIAHLSVTSSLSAAACSSLRPCNPPARTPTPRRIRLS